MEIYGTIIALGKDEREEETFIIQKRKFIIGSQAFSDIVLSEPSNSLGTRRCEISIDPFGRVSLINHDKIAILLNGDELKRKRPLEPGSIIEIGSHKFRWEKRTQTPEPTPSEKQNIFTEKSYTAPLHVDKLKRERDKDVRIVRKLAYNGRFTLNSISNEEKDEIEVIDDHCSESSSFVGDQQQPSTSINYSSFEDKENIPNDKKEAESSKDIVQTEISINSINPSDMSDDCVILDATADSVTEEMIKDKTLTPKKEEDDDDDLIVFSTPAVFQEPKENIVNILSDTDEDEFEDCKILSPDKINKIDAETTIKIELTNENKMQHEPNDDSIKLDSSFNETDLNEEKFNGSSVAKSILSTNDEKKLNLGSLNDNITNDCHEKSIHVIHKDTVAESNLQQNSLKPIESNNKQTRSDEIIDNEVDLNVLTPPLRLTRESLQIPSIKVSPVKSVKISANDNDDHDAINITLNDSQEHADVSDTKDIKESCTSNIENNLYDKPVTIDISYEQHQQQEPINTNTDYSNESTPPLTLTRKSLWVTSIKSSRKLGNSHSTNINEKTNTTLDDSQELIPNSESTVRRHKLRFSVDSPANEINDHVELNNESNEKLEASQDDYEISQNLIVTNDDDDDNPPEKLEHENKSISENNTSSSMENILPTILQTINESSNKANITNNDHDELNECITNKLQPTETQISINNSDKKLEQTYLSPIKSETNNCNRTSLRLSCTKKLFSECSYDFRKSIAKKALDIEQLPNLTSTIVNKDLIVVNTTEISTEATSRNNDDDELQIPLNEPEPDMRIIFDDKTNKKSLNISTQIGTPTRSIRTRKGSLTNGDISNSNPNEQKTVETPSRILRTRRASSLATLNETPIETPEMKSLRTRKGSVNDLCTPNQILDSPTKILRKRKGSLSTLVDNLNYTTTQKDTPTETPTRSLRTTRTRSVTQNLETPIRPLRRTRSSSILIDDDDSVMVIKPLIESKVMEETINKPENIIHTPKNIILKQKSSFSKGFTPKSAQKIRMETIKETIPNIPSSKHEIIESETTSMTMQTDIIKSSSMNIIKTTSKHVVKTFTLDQETEDVAEIKETIISTTEKPNEQTNDSDYIPKTTTETMETPINVVELRTYEFERPAVTESIETYVLPSEKKNKVIIIPMTIETEESIDNNVISESSSVKIIQSIPETFLHNHKSSNITKTKNLSPIKTTNKQTNIVNHMSDVSKSLSSENEIMNISTNIQLSLQEKQPTTNIVENTDVLNSMVEKVVDQIHEPNNTTATIVIIKSLPENEIVNGSITNKSLSTVNIETTPKIDVREPMKQESVHKALKNTETSEQTLIIELLPENSITNVSVTIEPVIGVGATKKQQEIIHNISETIESIDLSSENVIEQTNDVINTSVKSQIIESLTENSIANISVTIESEIDVGATKKEQENVSNASKNIETNDLSFENIIEQTNVAINTSMKSQIIESLPENSNANISVTIDSEIDVGATKEEQENVLNGSKNIDTNDWSSENIIEQTNVAINTPMKSQIIESLPENSIANISVIIESETDVGETKEEQENLSNSSENIETNDLSSENVIKQTDNTIDASAKAQIIEWLPENNVANVSVTIEPEIDVEIPKEEQGAALNSSANLETNILSCEKIKEPSNEAINTSVSIQILKSLPENNIANTFVIIEPLVAVETPKRELEFVNNASKNIKTIDLFSENLIEQTNGANNIAVQTQIMESLPENSIGNASVTIEPEIAVKTHKEEQEIVLNASQNIEINLLCEKLVEQTNEATNSLVPTQIMKTLSENQITHISELIVSPSMSTNESTMKMLHSINYVDSDNADLAENTKNNDSSCQISEQQTNNICVNTELIKSSSENSICNVAMPIESSSFLTSTKSIELPLEIAGKTPKKYQDSSKSAEIIDPSFEEIEQTNEATTNVSETTETIDSLQQSEVTNISTLIDSTSTNIVETTTEIIKSTIQVDHNSFDNAEIIDASFEMVVEEIKNNTSTSTETKESLQANEDTIISEPFELSIDYEPISDIAVESLSTEVIDLPQEIEVGTPEKYHKITEKVENIDSSPEEIIEQTNKNETRSVTAEIIDASLDNEIAKVFSVTTEKSSTEIIELTPEINEEIESIDKDAENTKITDNVSVTIEPEITVETTKENQVDTAEKIADNDKNMLQITDKTDASLEENEMNNITVSFDSPPAEIFELTPEEIAVNIFKQTNNSTDNESENTTTNDVSPENIIEDFNEVTNTFVRKATIDESSMENEENTADISVNKIIKLPSENNVKTINNKIKSAELSEYIEIIDSSLIKNVELKNNAIEIPVKPLQKDPNKSTSEIEESAEVQENNESILEETIEPKNDSIKENINSENDMFNISEPMEPPSTNMTKSKPETISEEKIIVEETADITDGHIELVNTSPTVENNSETINELLIPLNEHDPPVSGIIFDDTTNKKPLNNSTPIVSLTRSLRTRKGSITDVDLANVIPDDEKTLGTPITRTLRTRKGSVTAVNEKTVETPTRSLRQSRKKSINDINTDHNQINDHELLDTSTRILRKRKGSVSTVDNNSALIKEASVVTPIRTLRTTRSRSVTHNLDTPTRSLRRTRSSSVVIEDETNVVKLPDSEEMEDDISKHENIISTPKSSVRKQKGSFLKDFTPKSARKLKMETIEENIISVASTNKLIKPVTSSSKIKLSSSINNMVESTTKTNKENDETRKETENTKTIDSSFEITVEQTNEGVTVAVAISPKESLTENQISNISVTIQSLPADSNELTTTVDANKHNEKQENADINELIKSTLVKIEEQTNESNADTKESSPDITGTNILSSTTNINENQDNKTIPPQFIDEISEMAKQKHQPTKNVESDVKKKTESKPIKRGRNAKKIPANEPEQETLEKDDTEQLIQPELKTRGRNRNVATTPIEKTTEEIVPRKIGRTRRGTANILDSETKPNSTDTSSNVQNETVTQKTNTVDKDSLVNELETAESTKAVETIRKTRGRQKHVVIKETNEKEEMIKIDQIEVENTEKRIENKAKSTVDETVHEPSTKSRGRKRNLVVSDKISFENTSASTMVETKTASITESKPEMKKIGRKRKNSKSVNMEETENSTVKPDTQKIEAEPKSRGRKRNVVGTDKISVENEKTETSTKKPDIEKNIESQKDSDTVAKSEPKKVGRKRKNSEKTIENDVSDKSLVVETEATPDISTKKQQSKIVKKEESGTSLKSITSPQIKIADSELKSDVSVPKRQGRRKNIVTSSTFIATAATDTTEQIETTSKKIGRTRRGTADSLASNTEKPEIKTRGRKRNVSVTESEEQLVILDKVNDPTQNADQSKSIEPLKKVLRRGRQKVTTEAIKSANVAETEVLAKEDDSIEEEKPKRSVRNRDVSEIPKIIIKNSVKTKKIIEEKKSEDDQGGVAVVAAPVRSLRSRK